MHDIWSARQVKVAVGLSQADVPKEVRILPNGKPTAVSTSTSRLQKRQTYENNLRSKSWNMKSIPTRFKYQKLNEIGAKSVSKGQSELGIIIWQAGVDLWQAPLRLS